MQGTQHEPDRPGLGPLGADRKKLTEISKVVENMSRMSWSISDLGHTEKASKWLPYAGTLSERVHRPYAAQAEGTEVRQESEGGNELGLVEGQKGHENGQSRRSRGQLGWR